MAGVRVRVLGGPDEGLEVALGRAEVRIGRGAGANVPLTDPGVGGFLRVWFANGAYQVANEVTNTVGRPAAVGYLQPDGDGEQEFPPRSQGPWYNLHRIRVTADTVLVLTVDPDLDLPDGRFEVGRDKPPAQAKKEKDRLTVVAIVVLFAGAAVLFAADSEPGGGDRSDGETRGRYARVERQLRDAKATSRAADGVLARLREARFLEAYGRRAEAADQYVQARDDLNRALGTPDAPPAGPPDPAAADALRDAREFVADRLVDLNEFQPKSRSVR